MSYEMGLIKKNVSNIFSWAAVISLMLLLNSFSFSFLHPYSLFSSHAMSTNIVAYQSHQVQISFRTGYVEFEVVSEFQEPLVYIRVSGVEEKNDCVRFILGDGIHHFDFDFESTGVSANQTKLKHLEAQSEKLELQRVGVAEAKTIGLLKWKKNSLTRWVNSYRLYLFPPKPGDYLIVLRLEHTSMKEALRDYDNDLLSNSYLGKQYEKEFVFHVDDSFIAMKHKNNFKNLKSEASSETDVAKGIWFCKDKSSFKGIKSILDEHSWPYETQSCGESLLKQSTLEFEKNEKRQCRKITIIGDSQPSYACLRLKNITSTERQSKNGTNVLDIACINIKGALTITERKIQKYTHSKEYYYGNISKVVQSGDTGGGDVLLLNFAGLWEVAYGELNFGTLEEIIKDLLDVAVKIGFRRVFYMTTTQVLPSEYGGLSNDRRKWAMNQPRVERLNKITKTIIRKHFDGVVGIIDTGAMSMVLTEDYLPGDMRHFDDHGNDRINRFILCSIEKACSGEE